MASTGRHLHGTNKSVKDGLHGHPLDPALADRLAAIEKRLDDLEPVIPPDPDPEPEPTPGEMPVGGDPARRGPKPVAYRTPDATVTGTALADMKAAEDKAGSSGTVFVPAGVYPAPPGAVGGVRWQLDPNAIWATQFRPTDKAIAVEGGELRGGVWLGIGTNAVGITIQYVRVRNVGIFNESRSGLQVVGCDFQNISGECVRLWYDSSAHVDVNGLRIEDNTGKRTSYSVNGVGSFTGNDGGGKRRLFDPIFRNNDFDNGADQGQGPGGIGAFALFEFWGTVRQINEYNDLRGGGFLNSNVRSVDGLVRWNRGRLETGRAWAFYESGGSGTGGDRIYENEIIGDPARNGVIIATATPNPVKTVEVTGNRYSGCRLTSDPNAPGYNIHDNPVRMESLLVGRHPRFLRTDSHYFGSTTRQAPGEA